MTNCDLSNVQNSSNMFYGCGNLNEIRLGCNPHLNGLQFNMYKTKTNGKLYYNSAYDYSQIINVIPNTWEAIPCMLVNGVLIPN